MEIKLQELEHVAISKNLSPVAAAGGILDVVCFIERHDIKRDGTQKSTIWTARIGFKIGVRGDHDMPRHYSTACETNYGEKSGG